MSGNDFCPGSPESQNSRGHPLGTTVSLLTRAGAGGIPLPQTPGICLPGVKSVAELQARVAVKTVTGEPHATAPRPPARSLQSVPEAAPVTTALLGVEVSYVTDPTRARHAVAELLTDADTFGLDIETASQVGYTGDPAAGLDPYRSRIRLIQIATSNRVLVIDLDRVPRAIVEPLLQRTLVAHNAKFELKHLMQAGLVPAHIACTQLMARVVTGEPRLSLAAGVKRAFGWDVDKTLQKSDWSRADLSAEQIAYAALDAVLALRLAEAYRAELEQTGQGRAYARMIAALPVIARQELDGCPFDRAGHDRLIVELQAEWEQTRAALQVLLGEINPGSTAQLSTWLSTHLDTETLARWPRTATGQLATGAEALASFSEHPMVQLLLRYKEVDKRLSSYGSGFAKHIHPVTGRLHAEFHLAAADTGRFRCARPNLQNLPRDPRFRALIAPPPGYRLVVADYSQIELRVVALVAQDTAMLAAYAAGEDLHRKTAAAVLGIPVAEVTKGARQMAKAVNFGLLYGQSAKGLCRYARSAYGVAMDEAQAQRAIGRFFRTYPGVKIWQLRQQSRGRQTRKVTTPGGLVRQLKLQKGRVNTREALNTPIQGGAAECLLAALARLSAALVELDARLVNHVHDEIVLEVAERDVEAAKQALTEAMVAGFLDCFPLASTRDLVEASDGPNWAEAK